MTAGCVGTGCRRGGGEREFVEYGPDMIAMVCTKRSEQPTLLTVNVDFDQWDKYLQRTRGRRLPKVAYE